MNVAGSVRTPVVSGRRWRTGHLASDLLVRLTGHGQRGHDALVAVRRALHGRWHPAGMSLGGMGVLLAVTGPLAWWAGTRWGWGEARALALADALLMLAAVAFWVGRSPYQVAVDLARHRVVVGDRAVGSVEVVNASSRATLPAEIELPVGDAIARFALPRLAAGTGHEDLFAVPTQRRGVVRLGPLRSVRADPLGVGRREVRWTEPIDLFVHPRTVRLTGTSAGFISDLEGRVTQHRSSSDIAFHALREYVAGDDRRHVHWKSTARTGSLMVREYEETRRSHLAVGLSTRAEVYGDDPEEFELAVSVAGSVGLLALSQERDLTVLTEQGVIETRTAGRMLDGLTRVQPVGRAPDVVTLAAQLASTVPSASIAVLVLGPQTSSAQMHAAAVRLPAAVTVVAMRCEVGAQTSRRVIGGLTVLTVGSLEDLPAALRKVGQ